MAFIYKILDLDLGFYNLHLCKNFLGRYLIVKRKLLPSFYEQLLVDRNSVAFKGAIWKAQYADLSKHPRMNTSYNWILKMIANIFRFK